MENKIEELEKIAKEARINTFKAIANAGGGHYGGSLSVIEILTVLYFYEMKIFPQDPGCDERDRIVLSKGHAGPALYTILALRGFFPLEKLQDLDKPLSKFPKHIDRLRLEGIDASTGALGQGLSIACGIAISLKQQDKKNLVFAIVGDGEINSGQIWEAAMTASKYKLDNLITILDRNNCQIDGTTEDIMPMEPLDQKWVSFGWDVSKADGHNISALIEAIDNAKRKTGCPKIIIAKTIKGYGISFMENRWEWHSGKTSEEQYKRAIDDLGAEI